MKMDPLTNPSCDLNLFTVSYKIILNLIPYNLALTLSTLNKYFRRTFTSKIRKLIFGRPATVRRASLKLFKGYDKFFQSLNVRKLIVKIDINEILAYLPVSCRKLYIAKDNKVEWSLLDKSKPYDIQVVRFTYGKVLTYDEVENLPITLRRLSLPNFSSRISSLTRFSNLTHLSFVDRINRQVNDYPPNLTHLTFGYCFNQPIDNLPSNLTDLTFGKKFNNIFENLPSSLRSIFFGDSLNKSIDQFKTLSNLDTLSLGHDFNQEINHLPPLRSLVLGHNFNQTIDHLPLTFKILVLGRRFKKGIDKLPPLTHLTFGGHFNGSIDNLPLTLTHLTFGFGFNQPVDVLIHHFNLTHLSFGKDFNYPIYPKTITHLEVGYEFKQPYADLPPNVIHLVFKNCRLLKIRTLCEILPNLFHLGIYWYKGILPRFPEGITHLVLKDRGMHSYTKHSQKEVPILPTSLKYLTLDRNRELWYGNKKRLNITWTHWKN